MPTWEGLCLCLLQNPIPVGTPGPRELQLSWPQAPWFGGRAPASSSLDQKQLEGKRQLPGSRGAGPQCTGLLCLRMRVSKSVFLYSTKYFSTGSIPLMVSKASSPARRLGSEAHSTSLRMPILRGLQGRNRPACTCHPAPLPTTVPPGRLLPGAHKGTLKMDMFPMAAALSVPFFPLVLQAWHHVQKRERYPKLLTRLRRRQTRTVINAGSISVAETETKTPRD